MNVHYLNQENDDQILHDAIEDAKRFFKAEAPTIWDLCDCIADDQARTAVEELVGLFSSRDPAPEAIVSHLSRIVGAFLHVPFSVIDLLDHNSRLNGAASNAIRFYGPRLVDLGNRIARAASNGERPERVS